MSVSPYSAARAGLSISSGTGSYENLLGFSTPNQEVCLGPPGGEVSQASHEGVSLVPQEEGKAEDGPLPANNFEVP